MICCPCCLLLLSVAASGSPPDVVCRESLLPCTVLFGREWPSQSMRCPLVLQVVCCVVVDGLLFVPYHESRLVTNSCTEGESDIVRSCSCTSFGVGMHGVVAAFALIAGWCSSSSDSNCSLYCVFSSEFVEPVHCVASSGCGSVVQLSSTLLPLLLFVGLISVILAGRRLS